MLRLRFSGRGVRKVRQLSRPGARLILFVCCLTSSTVALSMLLFLAHSSAPSAQALPAGCVIKVSTALDNESIDTVVTFREAINFAVGNYGPAGGELDEITGCTVDANTPGIGWADLIVFDSAVFPSPGGNTIFLTSPAGQLAPMDTGEDSISGAGLVTVVGPGPNGGFNCLRLTSNGNVVRGLNLTSCGNAIAVSGNASGNLIGGHLAGFRNVIRGNGVGVRITGAGAQTNMVQGNYIGTDATGTVASSNLDGVVIESGAHDNLVGGTSAGLGNIISGNTFDGVEITGTGSNDNTVVGNLIGTNATGTSALANLRGVTAVTGADSNDIGGLTAGSRNVISGNGTGISLFGGNSNQVLGNYIGTQANGLDALPNSTVGIDVYGNSNIIGGTSVAARNIVSGNGGPGLTVTGGATFTSIAGNYIGTKANGTEALPNQTAGIQVLSGSTTFIGGGAAGARNIISGNNGDGIQATGGTSAQIRGNYVGVGSAGALLGNTGEGVELSGTSTGAFVGGSTATAGACDGDCNVISGNLSDGVLISGSPATSNLVSGNFLGVGPNGFSDFGNGQNGVRLLAAPGNTVGGTSANARNVIAGNSFNGVFIIGAGAIGNTVRGNYVGLRADGTAAVANSGHGVYVDGAGSTTIGGNSAGSGNVISGNSFDGVLIASAGATGTTVEGNRIGTNPGGTAALPNSDRGVRIVDAPGVTIGGTTGTLLTSCTGSCNLISGNADEGVLITGNGATGVQLLSNFIGANIGGLVALANGADGVRINDASSTTIGGTASNATNLISGNSGDGVEINNTGAAGAAIANTVQGNRIGTQGGAGAGTLPNGGNGVLITGAADNTIGGSANTTPASSCAGACNVISGNLGHGVSIEGAGAASNDVLGNYIGANVGGTLDRGNSGSGVRVLDGASNVIGGTSANARNLISGNDARGILIDGTTATGNQVLGNFIGTNAAGASALANNSAGVELVNVSASVIGGTIGTTPGGTCTGACNLISGNIGNGIWIAGEFAAGNLVQGNYIGLSAAGTGALGNGFRGITIGGGGGQTIGGTVSAARNVVSGNATQMRIESGPGSGDGNTIQGNFIGTNAAGNASLSPPGNPGLLVDTSGNLIGGTTNTTPGGACSGACNLISGNSNTGIEISGAGATGNQVLGNYVGTNLAGTQAVANGAGINILGASNNTIGGTSASARNVISGNTSAGVAMNGAAASGNVVQGNYIGTNSAGTAALPNAEGVFILAGASNNTVGGAASPNATDPCLSACNLISGNGLWGIRVTSGATGNLLRGNFIGTDAAGSGSIANQGPGIVIDGAPANTIGQGPSDFAGFRNTIANNAGDGIAAKGAGAVGNSILINRIRNNAGLGIDLGDDGVTLNDSAPDADSGPNNLQNFPVITTLSVTAGSTTVGFRLESLPNTPMVVLLFRNATCDGSGYGEGATPFAYVSGSSTDGNGILEVTGPVALELAPGEFLTAIATAPGVAGSASEFSRCRTWDSPASDDDGDGFADVIETGCGSDAFNPAFRPERLDTPGDDDGDGQINEGLPGGAASLDCDGDGYLGTTENSIYFPFTNRDQDPCGNDGWPSNLHDDPNPPVPTVNTLDIRDILSFVAPVRHFGTSPPNALFSSPLGFDPGTGCARGLHQHPGSDPDDRADAFRLPADAQRDACLWADVSIAAMIRVTEGRLSWTVCHGPLCDRNHGRPMPVRRR